MKYNSLVIGAGFMGSLKDSKEEEERIFTHGKAYNKHPGFNLVGFVDKDIKRSKEASIIWGGNYYSSIDEAFKNNKIDVVSIVTPDSEHFNTLLEVSNFPVKHVLCEKPFTETVVEAKSIIELYKKKSISGSLNYTRRYMPEIESLKNEIKQNSFGKYLFSTGYFGNGILHDGSHMVGLLLYLLNTVENFSYTEVPSDFYRIFELDIFFERKRVKLKDFTWQIEYQTPGISPFYGWQTHINYEKTVFCNIDKAMYLAVDDIYNHLTDKTSLKCSFKEGLKIMELCEWLEKKNLMQ